MKFTFLQSVPNWNPTSFLHMYMWLPDMKCVKQQVIFLLFPGNKLILVIFHDNSVDAQSKASSCQNILKCLCNIDGKLTKGFLRQTSETLVQLDLMWSLELVYLLTLCLKQNKKRFTWFWHMDTKRNYCWRPWFLHL